MLDPLQIANSKNVFFSDTDLLDGGFEVAFPDPDSNGYEYRPEGTPWTFSLNVGYSKTPSGFTSGNPAPPEGLQVLFLQGLGQASQELILDEGTYTLSFHAAQRLNFGTPIQQIQILVDGVSLGIFQPSSSGAYEYFETTFAVPVGGAYVLELKGLVSPQDTTVLVDDLRLVK